MNIKVLTFWIIVGLPLSWGLYKSIERAMPLFKTKLEVAKPAPVKPAEPPK